MDELARHIYALRAALGGCAPKWHLRVLIAALGWQRLAIPSIKKIGQEFSLLPF